MISLPDIAYQVSVVSRYLDNYDEWHWEAVAFFGISKQLKIFDYCTAQKK